MLEVLIVAIATLLGVITQRVVGFGIAAFLSTVALIFFEPSTAVIITLLAGTLSCALILFDTRHTSVVIRAVVVRLLITSIPGLLLGALIVTQINKALLQIVLGAVMIAGVLVQQYYFPKPIKALGVTRGISPSGFVIGLLNSVAANGAPAMILWMRSHVSSPDQIRQNFAALFVIMNLFSVATILIIKPSSFNGEISLTFAILAPVIVIASILGGQLAKRVNAKLFEKLVVIAIICTGLMTAALGIASYL